jgi:uncharacterized protein
VGRERLLALRRMPRRRLERVGSSRRLTWGTIVHTVWSVTYEWDPAKALANVRTHRVRFSEAVTVLEDELALTREDADAPGEQRFVTLGVSSSGRLLVVVYTYREPDSIRLIAAWKAHRKQEIEYEKGRRR